MSSSVSYELEQQYRSLLLEHYSASSPKVLASASNKAGMLNFAISLKDDQLIIIAEINRPTVEVIVEHFAEEWVREKINASLGEHVKNCFKRRGRLLYQTFELDTRDNYELKIRRVTPFGQIEWPKVLPHTQFSYEYYTAELQQLNNEIIDTEDYKKAFAKIKALSEALKNTLIGGDQKKELFEKLNICYQSLEKKQAQTKEAFDKECENNYQLQLVKCQAIQQNLQENPNFKEIREQLKQVTAELRDLTLKKSNRNELYDLVHACYAEIDKRKDEAQEEYEKNCLANFEKLKTLAEAERENCKNTTDINQQRETLKKIQNESWESKLQKEQRNTLHELFNVLFELLNQRYEVLKEEIQKESESNFGSLQNQLNEIQTKADSPAQLKATHSRLKQMQKELQDARLTPKHKQEMWTFIDKAFKSVNAKMDEVFGEEKRMQEEHYAAFKPKLMAAAEASAKSENFKEQREILIKLQEEYKTLKLSKKMREELWRMFDDAFKDLSTRADAYFAQKRNERVEKEKGWRKNMEQKVVRLQMVIKTLEKANLDDRGYITKMDDWLSTIRENKNNVELRQGFMEKITTAQKQIDERLAKIKDIKKNIKEIEAKLREEPKSKTKKQKEEPANAIPSETNKTETAS